MTSVYKHLKERIVQLGDTVRRGQQIGTLGDTGLLSALPHLHFETRQNLHRTADHPVDPHFYWVGGIGQVTCFKPGLTLPKAPFLTTYPVACGQAGGPAAAGVLRPPAGPQQTGGSRAPN